MAREVAPTNIWAEKKGSGARYGLARLIADPDFPGFVTIAEAGVEVALLVDDPNHAGFVTPDTAATERDATLFVIGGFAVVVGS